MERFKAGISGKLILIFPVLFWLVSCSSNDPNSQPSTHNVIPVDFLSASSFDKLVVELHYVNGFAPTTAAVNNLKSFLEQYLNKPVGISFVETTMNSPGKSSLSVTDSQSIENVGRSQKTVGKTLTAYVFFADADYSSNNGSSSVLGIAYGGSSMMILEKTIRNFSGGISQPSLSTLETVVLEHEFGHLFGLVNNGTNMQVPHQDTANGKHCDDTNCLMFYTVETSDIIANLVGGNIPVLTTTCLNDLRANGSK